MQSRRSNIIMFSCGVAVGLMVAIFFVVFNIMPRHQALETVLFTQFESCGKSLVKACAGNLSVCEQKP